MENSIEAKVHTLESDVATLKEGMKELRTGQFRILITGWIIVGSVIGAVVVMVAGK